MRRWIESWYNENYIRYADRDDGNESMSILVNKHNLEIGQIWNFTTWKDIPTFHDKCGNKYKFFDGIIFCDRCKKMAKIKGIQE
jgi:hypothetical protein